MHQTYGKGIQVIPGFLAWASRDSGTIYDMEDWRKKNSRKEDGKFRYLQETKAPMLGSSVD